MAKGRYVFALLASICLLPYTACKKEETSNIISGILSGIVVIKESPEVGTLFKVDGSGVRGIVGFDWQSFKAPSGSELPAGDVCSGSPRNLPVLENCILQSPGQYTVSLKARFAGGAESIEKKTFDVTSATSGPAWNLSVFDGETNVFTFASNPRDDSGTPRLRESRDYVFRFSGSAGSQYFVDWGSGFTPVNAEFTKRFSPPGYYRTTVKVVNGNAISTRSFFLNIVCNDLNLPQLIVNADAVTITPGNTRNFFTINVAGSASGGKPNYKYSWDPEGDGTFEDFTSNTSRTEYLIYAATPGYDRAPQTRNIGIRVLDSCGHIADGSIARAVPNMPADGNPTRLQGPQVEQNKYDFISGVLDGVPHGNNDTAVNSQIIVTKPKGGGTPSDVQLFLNFAKSGNKASLSVTGTKKDATNRPYGFNVLELEAKNIPSPFVGDLEVTVKSLSIRTAEDPDHKTATNYYLDQTQNCPATAKVWELEDPDNDKSDKTCRRIGNTSKGVKNILTNIFIDGTFGRCVVRNDKGDNRVDVREGSLSFYLDYRMKPTDCTPPAVCGDSIKEGTEECEPPGSDLGKGSVCGAGCKVQSASCGDGIKSGDEECDKGSSNSDTGSCLLNCKGAGCGDGKVWTGHEQCDDGNKVDDDSCSNSCKVPGCGDNIKQAGEFCDPPGKQLADGTFCNANCGGSHPQSCGDGIRDGSEGCDDGNSSNNDACLNTCKGASCGDGFVRTGVEQCDDGNTKSGDGCDNICRAESCGNGRVDVGEQCDDGNNKSGDGCSATCAAEPAQCGNGNKEAGEDCDDGNTKNGDGCSSTCKTEPPAPVCGNGKQESGEECDDGNGSNTDSCVAQCKNSKCGDGFVQKGVEECDCGSASLDNKGNCTTQGAKCKASSCTWVPN